MDPHYSAIGCSLGIAKERTLEESPKPTSFTNQRAPYSKDNPWWEDPTYRCHCVGCTGPNTCSCCLGHAQDEQALEYYTDYDEDDGPPRRCPLPQSVLNALEERAKRAVDLLANLGERITPKW